MTDPTTPQSGPVTLPDYQELEASQLSKVLKTNDMFENVIVTDDDSPDSGTKEMSSYSLSNSNFFTSPDANKVIDDAEDWGKTNSLAHQVAPPKSTTNRQPKDIHGNRLELNVTPKLDPPPSSKRAPRSLRTTEEMLNGDESRNARNIESGELDFRHRSTDMLISFSDLNLDELDDRLGERQPFIKPLDDNVAKLRISFSDENNPDDSNLQTVNKKQCQAYS